MKIFFLFLSFFLISCVSESDDEGNSTSNNSSGIEFSGTSFSFRDNLDEAAYIVESNNSLSSNSVSKTVEGYSSALSSNDQLIEIFESHDSSFLTEIVSYDGKKILSGEFSNSSDTCILLYKTGDSYNCLLIKQESVSSAGAGFIGDVLYLLVSLSSGGSELYSYKTEVGFSELSDNNVIVPLASFSTDSDVVHTMNTGDLISFHLSGDSKDIVHVRSSDGAIETKIESVTSPSVQEVDGEALFMSDGNLRQGWSKSIYYNSSDNNRTISDSNILISNKDAYLQIYFQSDYTDEGFNLPSIFYLKPRRGDLPISYPDYTLDPISCCRALNNPSGTRTTTEPISWQIVSGYKRYAMAYGVNAGENVPEYNSGDITIEKALIAIDGDDYFIDSDGDAVMSHISLYDHNNPSSDEDNLINILSFDSVTSIENYVRGFKITGPSSPDTSTIKTVYYNPYTSQTESPNTTDQQSFNIVEAL